MYAQMALFPTFCSFCYNVCGLLSVRVEAPSFK